MKLYLVGLLLILLGVAAATSTSSLLVGYLVVAPLILTGGVFMLAGLEKR